MTENKRFECKTSFEWWWVRDNDGKVKGELNDWFSDDKVVDLLNELYNETEQLKKENQKYKSLLQDMGLLMSDEQVVDLLNEQEDKINRLKKSRDKWNALAENFNAFYNCYEKAINEVCDQETIDKIETAYAEHEKQVELK